MKEKCKAWGEETRRVDDKYSTPNREKWRANEGEMQGLTEGSIEKGGQIHRSERSRRANEGEMQGVKEGCKEKGDKYTESRDMVWRMKEKCKD